MIADETTASNFPHSFLKAGQETGFLLLLILIPLCINLWGQHPIELPKVLLLRTIIWLLAALTLIQYLFNGRSLRRDLQANPLLGAACLLALVIVVTTVTAVNTRYNFWGSIERGQGAVTLLSYLLLFLLAANYCRSLTLTRRLLTGMVITAVPLIVVALLQALGWDLFGLVSDARSPVYATLGRANFLGAYLAILVPITLALYLTQAQKWRLGLTVLFIAELLVIGLTLARSAWLATAVSLTIFALLWWGNRLTRHWRILAGIGVGLLFFSGPLLVWWQGQNELGSTAARLAIWQGTVELIRERPLLGYGADSLGLVFSRVYPPELVYYQGREFFVDRAHNLLLDWAMTTGLPGLLAFLFLLISFVFIIAKALRQSQPKEKEKRIFLVAILAAVLGNVANNLVSFDVTATAAANWFLMGAGVALTMPSATALTTPIHKRPYPRYILVGLLLAGIVAFTWWSNGRLLTADISARAAQLHTQNGRLTQATSSAERAVAYWPDEPTYHLQLSQIYWKRAAAEPAVAPVWLEEAETALQTAVHLQPESPNLWLHLAQFYTASARQHETDTRHLANHAYQQALALAPNHATIYTLWGRTYLQEDDPETAVSLLRLAVKLDASNGEAYIHLGAAEMALGRLDAALGDYQEAIRHLPQSSDAYAGLAHCYWQLNQPQAAQQALTEALRHNPQNAQAIALQQTIQQTP